MSLGTLLKIICKYSKDDYCFLLKTCNYCNFLTFSCLSLLAGITVRVYCQVGKSDQGKFALEVAVKTLDLYKEYDLISLC